MKPATGNNPPQSVKPVSIQLLLGGHSFSAETLPATLLQGGEPVLLSVVTPRTLLVPAEEFSPELERRCLHIAGLPPLADETTVHSDAEFPEVAVMALSKACMAALRERLGDRMRFTSPLLTMPRHAGRCTLLHQADDTLYIRNYGPELRYAAAHAAPTEADALVLLTDLAAALDLRDDPVYVTGDGARETARLLRRMFHRVLCG